MKPDFYFTIVDNCVMLDKRFSPTDKLVFWALSKHANRETKSCRVYLKTIAEEVSRSIRTVQRALRKLLEKGIIFIESCFSKTGRQLASKYTVLGKDADCYQNFISESFTIKTNSNNDTHQKLEADNELTTRCQDNNISPMGVNLNTNIKTMGVIDNFGIVGTNVQAKSDDNEVLMSDSGDLGMGVKCAQLINRTINNINNRGINYPYGVSEAYQPGRVEKENSEKEAEKISPEKNAEKESLKPSQEHENNFEVKSIPTEKKIEREPSTNEYEEKQLNVQHENLNEPEACTLEDVPSAMKETAEYMLFKTGRKNFTFDEISALKKLLVIHYPARVQREITKVVDRFTKKKRSLATITFSYIYEALKNQRSFFGFKKQSQKQPPKTENPSNLIFALDSYESNSRHFSEDDLKRLEANLC